MQIVGIQSVGALCRIVYKSEKGIGFLLSAVVGADSLIDSVLSENRLNRCSGEVAPVIKRIFARLVGIALRRFREKNAKIPAF